MNVDDDQGQDHFFRIDLVTRAQSLNEMRRNMSLEVTRIAGRGAIRMRGTVIRIKKNKT